MIAPDIIHISPNSTPGTPTGRGVVIHATRSGVSNNPSEFQGTLNWFGRPDVGLSSHWVIARDGRKARVVPDDKRAVHAGEHNATHWGIELEQGVEDDGFTVVQLSALVDVCRGYVHDFGVPAVHATSSAEPGFIGHQETAQGRRVGKSDPGRWFPWTNFIAALREGNVDEREKQELDERRAKAELDIALLFKYRTRPVRSGWVEIVTNAGAPLNPPVVIDVSR